MVCSTGTATPRGGVYKLNTKYRWLPLFGNVYGQYCSRITGYILFHSVPYLRNREPDSLEYWEYDKLGTAASAGCVRLTVADAKWIYDNCASGCYVEFCTTLNVSKPSAAKISSNEACRNYDPTDPVANNPWRNYVEPSTPTESPKTDPTPETKPDDTPNPGSTDNPDSKDPDSSPKPSEGTDEDKDKNNNNDKEPTSDSDQKPNPNPGNETGKGTNNETTTENNV